MDFLSFLTPRNIFEFLLASGFLAQLLPPVNKFIAKIVGNRYGRIGLDLAKAMEDGKISEDEGRGIIGQVYRIAAEKSINADIEKLAQSDDLPELGEL